MNTTITTKDLNLDDLQMVYAYHYWKVYDKYPVAGPQVTKPVILAQIELLQKIQRRFK
jgi:hypothetical protein